MYPPPPIEIVRQLHGAKLEVVSFGKYTCHLGFAGGQKLSFGAPFRYAKVESLANSLIEEFPLTETRLVASVGSSVVGVELEEDGTLELRFSDNNFLVVYSNDPTYEAYSLTVNGKEYTV